MFGLPDNLVPLLERGVKALEQMAAALAVSAEADRLMAQLTQQTIVDLERLPWNTTGLDNL